MSLVIILFLLNLVLNIETIPINIDEEVQFNQKTSFHLDYLKQTDKNIMFILFYEKEGNLQIFVNLQELEKNNTFEITNDNGYIYVPYYGNGAYEIELSPKDSEENIYGKIRIVSTEFIFKMDINKDIQFEKIELLNEFEPNPIIFELSNYLDKEYMKEINTEYSNLYISENENEFKKITNKLIFFKTGISYKIKLEFTKLGNNYILNNFLINDLNTNNYKIEELSLGLKHYKNITFLITKINFNIIKKFKIIEENGQSLKMVYIDDEEKYNNFPNEIQFFEFKEVKNKDIEKPNDIQYAILLFEFDNIEENLISFIEEIPIELNEEKVFNNINLYFKLLFKEI